MWYLLYVCLLVLVVFLSIKLADYVDLLDKKTKVSGAFIGGVMLAAVTSLPELFTSFSAVALVKQPELVIGNIFGSDSFNMVVLALCMIVFFKAYRKARVDKVHLWSCFALLGMYLLSIYALFLPKHQVMIGWFNLITPLIILLYALIIWKQPKVDEGEKEETDSPLTVKTIILRFAICAILLIAVSIGITYVTDIVADKLSLGKTVAGAILLGIATSLPELVSTFSLCKKGNFNAGFGNISGSNIFNFFILGFADLISKKSIYISSPDAKQFSIFGIAAAVSLTILILLKSKEKIMEKKWMVIPVVFLSLVIIACYLLVFFL